MQINSLFRWIQEELANEVTDEYRKKLDRWGKEVYKGAGRRFSTAKEAIKHLRSL